ncbi:uncharacterized protein LOC111386699 [Olea europaea var. sylvestris]|uniref:uncharacterized protein LOC111386699 n=1 Tax=Olea europaea var. sylvestris TaxID=158386 RepID=UPI000C1D708B|nr:uncharacterized protein LOC111386699 [Olea europaea var. sylvestris]
MDDQSSLLNLAHLYQEKGVDGMRQSLLLTMELEDTRLKAQDELKMRDEQIVQLKIMLSRAIKERDEAQDKCQKMFFEKLLLQNHCQKSITSIEDEPRRRMDSINGFSSSDCEESIVSSPPSAELPIMANRPLPTKGKLLQAVMEAGPLLQTLLLAGPLPQWRHPPPQLDTRQIPPPPVVVIPAPPLKPFQQELLHDIIATNNNINNCGRIERKRGFCVDFDGSIESKYQTVGLH